MRAFRPVRRARRLMALSLVALVVPSAGCGSKHEDAIEPGDVPAEKAKDSMDYYREHMLQGSGS